MNKFINWFNHHCLEIVGISLITWSLAWSPFAERTLSMILVGFVHGMLMAVYGQMQKNEGIPTSSFANILFLIIMIAGIVSLFYMNHKCETETMHYIKKCLGTYFGCVVGVCLTTACIDHNIQTKKEKEKAQQEVERKLKSAMLRKEAVDNYVNVLHLLNDVIEDNVHSEEVRQAYYTRLGMTQKQLEEKIKSFKDA